MGGTIDSVDRPCQAWRSPAAGRPLRLASRAFTGPVRFGDNGGMPGALSIDTIGPGLKRKAERLRLRLRSRRAWNYRFGMIYRTNPQYRRPVDAEVERRHLAQWRRLRKGARPDTLRVCSAISGVVDPDYVPEEVYASEIERVLNPRPMIEFLEFKGGYNRWFPDAGFPRAWMHDIEGIRYDAGYRPILSPDMRALADTFSYPVVLKPSIDSLGGDGVVFLRDAAALVANLDGKRNFVVQERIDPHPYFRRFSEVGLNTFRVCLYRSVRDNRLHVLNIALRMGKGGSLDNETAGGIVCFIDENGRMNPYAVDKWGTKFPAHPDNRLVFAEQSPIPDLAGLKAQALRVAEGIFFARVMSLDLCYDADERWRMIEVNLFRHTIRFSQYAGRPFFGPFTGEVLSYCEQRKA